MNEDQSSTTKRIATVIATVWVGVFVLSAGWLNAVPSPRSMFEVVRLQGTIEYGFPLPFASVRFPREGNGDIRPSRFLWSNLDRLRIDHRVGLLLNLFVAFLLAFVGFVGVRRACAESRLVLTLAVVVFVLVASAGCALPLWRHLLPRPVDSAALAICILWLTLTIGTIQHSIETLCSRWLRNPDEHR